MSLDPRDWTAKAEADFNSAQWEMQAPAATLNFDAVVFHAQQCIEKLLKAVLVSRRVPFDRTHDLNILAHVMKHAEPSWVYDPGDLAVIQPGAVLLRYPGYSATQQDAEEALEACKRLRLSIQPFV